MLKRAASVVGMLVVIAVSTAQVASPPSRGVADGLTVHEWGTFTTVAGVDGRAIDWLPLGGPTDLPCFVEHYRNNSGFKFVPIDQEASSLTYDQARGSMWAKVRMETPVIYFYSPRAVTANVRVAFPRGLVTEWFPFATADQGLVTLTTLKDAAFTGKVEWKDVKIAPNTNPVFPTGDTESHYYAARATDAAPVTVAGNHEKFLFYRGVANFDVPLTATLLANGGVQVRNLGTDALPNVVLFENRGGAIGYRINGALGSNGTVALEPPEMGSSFAALRTDLERMLVSGGLYPREAAAMVETWRTSWFEEGTRVFYIFPARSVDATLPLTIDPAPAAVARVFVGRMELLTSALQHSIQDAIARNDTAGFERFGRFAGPIADRLMANTDDVNARVRIRRMTETVFRSYVQRASTCEEWTEVGGPLYVIDGKPLTVYTADAMKGLVIESVEVVRGAAAIEQFGKRAAGGVIMIKTKSAKGGKGGG